MILAVGPWQSCNDGYRLGSAKTAHAHETNHKLSFIELKTKISTATISTRVGSSYFLVCQ